VRVWKAHAKTVYALAFLPDGERIATIGLDGWLRLWDVRGAPALVWERHQTTSFTTSAGEEIEGHWVLGGLAVSRNGWWLATGPHWDGPVRLWSVDGQPRVELEDTFYNPRLAFSPDGQTLAVVGSALSCWHVPSGRALFDWANLTSARRAVDYSPDGLTLATGGGNRADVLLWDVESGAVRAHLLPPFRLIPSLVAFAPNGRLLVALSAKELRVWDLTTQASVWSTTLPNRHFQGAAFSPDSRTLATAGNDETVRLWDTTSWAEQHAFTWPLGQVLGVAFAPDGQRGAACGRNGKVVVWDLDD
jgi:WD40 repeat protein